LTTALKNPPNPNEIEITLFGPGIGEAVLVHCGEGQWICVDCACFDGNCWPLSYLQDLNIPKEAMRLIIATHWHADHVNGISKLVEAYPNAQFVCSAALRTDEFQELVARFSEIEPGAARSPLLEVRKSFALLAAAKAAASPSYRPPIFANAHRVLDKFTVGGRQIEVMALSPSPQDELDAKEAFASYFVPVDQPATGLSPIAQNHASVVLAVQIDKELLLLGADLQQTNSAHSGWNAIVASHIRPQQKSVLFKVPHHGSMNAQSDAVWNTMLETAVFAGLTPYLPSGLPRPEGVSWLVDRSENVYATSLPKSSGVRRRSEVEKTIREATVSFESRRVPSQPGIVRFRKPSGAPQPWGVEMFGEAVKLVAA
jgi:beta-lactamase superfamily II metal-dependent hydrolase